MSRKIKYYSAKRRKIYAEGEEISHLEIFERDGWVCQLCNKPINRRYRQPSWWCATLDHIMPLSLGGQHMKSNLQAAHNICNQRKGSQVFGPETFVAV